MLLESVQASRLPSCYGQSGDSPPLELNSILLQICLPPDKLKEILEELAKWQSCGKTTKRKLLSLIGKLCICSTSCPSGQAIHKAPNHTQPKAKRLHHCIRLNSDAQADIAWWQEFMPTWNGTAQFVDQQPTDAADLELYTDALGTRGCDTYFQGK